MAEYEGLKCWEDTHGAYVIKSIDERKACIEIYLCQEGGDEPVAGPDVLVNITATGDRWACASLEVNSMTSDRTNDFVLGLFKHQDELSAAETIVPVIRQLLK